MRRLNFSVTTVAACERINQEDNELFSYLKRLQMKKLNKLEINLEKVMSNNELIKLRGGYDCWTCEVKSCGETVYIEDLCGLDLYTVQAECTIYWGLPCYCL